MLILEELKDLIHISDLAWERVNRVEDVVNVGDKVEVFVGEVDEKRKIIFNS